MKKIINELRDFIKGVEAFDFDFKQYAQENYDYSSPQYDSTEKNILPEVDDEHEQSVDLKIDFCTNHIICAGGYDEMPYHDVNLISVSFSKIIFNHDFKEYDLTENLQAVEIIKNYINNE
jgi:hypothetical protein